MLLVDNRHRWCERFEQLSIQGKTSITRCRNPHVGGLETRRMSVLHELRQVFEDHKPDGSHSANLSRLLLIID